MPRLRHSLAWDTSTRAVDAVEQGEQHDNIDGIGTVEQGFSTYEDLRDVLSELVIRRACETSKPGKDGRRNRSKDSRVVPDVGSQAITAASDSDVEDLQEFIEYLASEIHGNLPDDIRDTSSLSREGLKKLLADDSIQQLVAATPVTVVESLETYDFVEREKAHTTEPAQDFLADMYTAYVQALVDMSRTTEKDLAPSRPEECELCGRDWITLTVHHLIPREMWPKAVKRGWIANEEEGHCRIAWICRACHNLVHRIASNEELARRWNSIELLEERDDVQRFVAWAGRVRCKKR